MPRAWIPRITAAQLIALLPIAIGLLGASRWLFGPTSFGQAAAGSVELGVVAPFLLLIAGGACLGIGRAAVSAAGRRDQPRDGDRLARHITVAACLIIGLFAALMLVEHFSGQSLGIDIHRAGIVPTPSNPAPGRMSPNACIGFLCVAVALWFLPRPTAHRSRAWSGFAIAGFALIGTAGLLGKVLDLEELYRFAGANRLTPHVATALVGLALSLWLIRDQRRAAPMSMERHERRITLRSGVVLTLLVVASGAGGFAVIRTAYARAQAEHLALTADVNAESMAYSLQMARWINELAASRPAIIETLERLAESPNDARARFLLDRAAQSFITSGTVAVRLESLNGIAASAGHFSLRGNEASLPLAGPFRGSRLVYAGGLMLAAELPIRDHGVVVGRYVSEQRLVLFDRLIQKLQSATDTTDVVICARVSNDAVCLPSRFQRATTRVPMFDPHGNRIDRDGVVNQSIAGAAGTRTETDSHHDRVIAAYQPLGDTGLGMVVRTSAETLYDELRSRLAELAALLASCVVIGTWAMRSQVRPLVGQLAREQRRSAAILEHSNDAFVSLDREGFVNGWNAEAVRVFGWTVDEATGKRLSELIIPAGHRAAHDRGFRQFTLTGAGPVVNRRIELTAQRRDGTLLPVELSVAATHMGDHFAATAFLRDISGRRQAEQALLQSEQRLRRVADNMPALISYVDRDYRYTFVNSQYKSWFSLTDDPVGKTIAQVFGEAVFEGVRKRMDDALSGNDVIFELTNPVPGAAAHMLVHYMPDRDSNGIVVGLYGLIIDRTEQHLAKERLEASERQLRTVTDNLPVLMTYLDAEEKIRYLNKTFNEWLGLDLESSIGRPVADVVGAEHYEKRREQLHAALRGERVEFEVVSQTLSGLRTLQTVYIPDKRPDGSVRGIFSLATDVTSLKAIERQLHALAREDTLTGLPNRRRFEERLQEALSRSTRTRRPMALVFLDVDHFKSINDRYGHGTGDKVLQEFARRLTSTVRSTDTVARLAGDEFVIILEGLNVVDEAQLVAAKLVASIRLPMQVEGEEIFVTTSMGVAYRNGEADDVTAKELVERADKVLYRAKEAGRNEFRLTTV